GIFTSYHNKILDIPASIYFDNDAPRDLIIQRNQEGHSLGEFFGYKVIGLFQSEEDVDKSPDQDDAEPGAFKYADINGDGLINDEDRTFIGNPHPDFTYGLNISFRFKN